MRKFFIVAVCVSIAVAAVLLLWQRMRLEKGDTVRVHVYYYNPALDQGPGGAQCSPKGLVAVARVLPRSETPLADAINALLAGNVQGEETSDEAHSEFPLQDVVLKEAIIDNGVALLTFDDPQNRMVGGACRIAVLRHQIEATAMQFATVRTVRILPETILQP